MPESSHLLFLNSNRASSESQRRYWRSQMLTTFFKLLSDEKGATAIEYGLIAALIAVAAVTVLGTVGSNLTATFSTVAGKL